ncbi:hypothetical protein HPB47_014762, partial [Ixodes persulcatus]
GTCESRCLVSGVTTNPEPCGFARPRLAVRGFPVSGEKGILVVEPSPGRQSGAWRWALERAAVASRWTWLQAQVADLEFRIRQQSDLCRQLRRAKGPLRLEGADGGDSTTDTTLPQDTTTAHCEHDSTGELCACKGPTTSTAPAKPNGLVLPSPQDATSGTTSSGGGCVRTRGLAPGFRKRKVVLAASALASARKSARLSATVQCSCRSVCGPSSPAGWGAASSALPGLQGPPESSACASGQGLGTPSCFGEPSAAYPPLSPCLVCAGRYNSVRPLDADLMTRQERAALLDPGFHPVLSFRSGWSETAGAGKGGHTGSRGRSMQRCSGARCSRQARPGHCSDCSAGRLLAKLGSESAVPREAGSTNLSVLPSASRHARRRDALRQATAVAAAARVCDARGGGRLLLLLLRRLRTGWAASLPAAAAISCTLFAAAAPQPLPRYCHIARVFLRAGLLFLAEVVVISTAQQ